MKKLDDYVNEFAKYKISEGRNAEKTISRYITYIKEMFDYMNIKTLNDMKEVRFPVLKMNYINKKRDEGLSAASLNLRITSIQSFWTFMIDMEYLDKNPASKIKKFKVQAREVDVNINDIKKINAVLDDEFNKKPSFMTARNRLMIKTFLVLGLRKEELSNIKISDINIHGEFTVKGKYGKERQLQMPKKILEMYNDYILNYKTEIKDSEFVFCSVRGNKMDVNVPLRVLKETLIKAGLPTDMHVHDLRHIAATLMVESTNGDIEGVSKVLGHSDTRVLSKTYNNMRKENKKNIIENNIVLEII